MPAVPDPTAVPAEPVRKTRRLLLIGVAAAVLVGGAVTIPLVRSDEPRPFELDTTWGNPTAINVGAAGDPFPALQAGVASAKERVEFGELHLDPKDNQLAKIAPPLSASEAVAGTVPSWFPTIDGAQHLQSVLQGGVRTEDVVAAHLYQAKQLSLISSTHTVEELGTDVAAVLEGTWPKVTKDSGGSRPYKVSARGKRAGLTRADSLSVSFETSPAFPGLVLVEVDAYYTVEGPLRPSPRPHPASLTGIAAVAADEGWAAERWYEGDGIDAKGWPYRDQTVNWRSETGEIASMADSVADRVGVPDRGNVEDSNAYLSYADGQLQIGPLTKSDPLPSIRWTSKFPGKVVPGPLASIKAGVPSVVIDVDARPLEPGSGQERTVDGMTRFQQAGIPAIDGAVAITLTSTGTVRGLPASSYTHLSGQLVLVDTPLKGGQVSDRIKAALATLGATQVEVESQGFYVDKLASSFTARTPIRGGVGNGSFQVEVGTLDDHPGRVAVWFDVSIELPGELPEPPAFAKEYFATPQAVADPSWTPTRWYVVQDRTVKNKEVVWRGELEWLTDVRGANGLDATVALVEDRTHVKPEEISPDLFWFESDSDWSVSAVRFETYSRTNLEWEGGFQPVS